MGKVKYLSAEAAREKLSELSQIHHDSPEFWDEYRAFCKQQIFNARTSPSGKIYVDSFNTGTTVARYCAVSAEFTEFGKTLGGPGTDPEVFKNFSNKVKEFYRVDVTKLRPSYVMHS